MAEYRKERTKQSKLKDFNAESQVYPWGSQVDRKFEVSGDGLETSNIEVSYEQYLDDLTQALNEGKKDIEYNLTANLVVKKEDFTNKYSATAYVKDGQLFYTNLANPVQGDRVFNEDGTYSDLVVLLLEGNTLKDIDGNTYTKINLQDYKYKVRYTYADYISEAEVSITTYGDTSVLNTFSGTLRETSNLVEGTISHPSYENISITVEGASINTNRVSFTYKSYIDTIYEQVKAGTMSADKTIYYNTEVSLKINPETFTSKISATAYIDSSNQIFYTNSGIPILGDKIFDSNGVYKQVVQSLDGNTLKDITDTTYTKINLDDYGYKIDYDYRDYIEGAYVTATVYGNGTVISTSSGILKDISDKTKGVLNHPTYNEITVNLEGNSIDKATVSFTYESYINTLYEQITNRTLEDDNRVHYNLPVYLKINPESFTNKYSATAYIGSSNQIVYTNTSNPILGNKIFDSNGAYNNVVVLSLTDNILRDLDGNNYTKINLQDYGYKIDYSYPEYIKNADITVTTYGDNKVVSTLEGTLTEISNKTYAILDHPSYEKIEIVIDGESIEQSVVSFTYSSYIDTLYEQVTEGSIASDNKIHYGTSIALTINQEPFTDKYSATAYVKDGQLFYTNSSNPILGDRIFNEDGSYSDLVVVSLTGNALEDTNGDTYTKINLQEYGYKVDYTYSSYLISNDTRILVYGDNTIINRYSGTLGDVSKSVQGVLNHPSYNTIRVTVEGTNLEPNEISFTYTSYIDTLYELIKTGSLVADKKVHYVSFVSVKINTDPFIGFTKATAWLSEDGSEICLTNSNYPNVGDRVFTLEGEPTNVGIISSTGNNITDATNKDYSIIELSEYFYKIDLQYANALSDATIEVKTYNDGIKSKDISTTCKLFNFSKENWNKNIGSKKLTLSGSSIVAIELNDNYSDYLKKIYDGILNNTLVNNTYTYTLEVELIVKEEEFIGLQQATPIVNSDKTEILFVNSESPNTGDRIFLSNGTYFKPITSVVDNIITDIDSNTYEIADFYYTLDFDYPLTLDRAKITLANTFNPDGIEVILDNYKSPKYKWNYELPEITYSIYGEYVIDNYTTITLEDFYNNMDIETGIASFRMNVKPISKDIYAWGDYFTLSETPRVGDFIYNEDGTYTHFNVTEVDLFNNIIKVGEETLERNQDKDTDAAEFAVEYQVYPRYIYIANSIMDDTYYVYDEVLDKEVKLDNPLGLTVVDNTELFQRYYVEIPVSSTNPLVHVYGENPETEEPTYNHSIEYDVLNEDNPIILARQNTLELYVPDIPKEGVDEIIYYAWESTDGNTYYTKTQDDISEIFVLNKTVFEKVSRTSDIELVGESLKFKIISQEVEAQRTESLDIVVESITYYAWTLPNGTVIYTTTRINPTDIYVMAGSLLAKLTDVKNINVSNGEITFISNNDIYSANKHESSDIYIDNGFRVTEKTDFAILDNVKVDVKKDLKPDFDVNRDFIRLMIPDNLRDTWVFERVADIFYAVISDNTKLGKEIKGNYYNIEFYHTDFTKLSLDMKLRKLHDMGFDYLVEVFGSGEQQLNDLSAFLNLIKILKGRKEGFKLILDTLGIAYKASSWEDLDYKNEIFTYNIVLTLSTQQTQLSTDLINTIQKIARAYLAPQVNITYTVLEDLLSENEYFNAKYSGNYQGKSKIKLFEFSRSLK